jgi:hypothetical protein
MKATVTILDTNLEVEYDFEITAHGCPERGPSYSSGGEPAEPAEFELEVLGIEFPKQHADVHLELPEWLKDMLTSHLYERDDINEIVQRADSECGYDPDDERI